MIRSFRLSSILSTLCLLTMCMSAVSEEIALDRKELAAMARLEADGPVRPGSPGEQPFWNGYARRFIHAPSFDFEAVEGADAYRFSAESGVDFKTYSFDAAVPWADLSPIWRRIPTGMVRLKIEATRDGAVVAEVGEQTFHKGAYFRGPYRGGAEDYRETARKLLAHMMEQPYYTHWLETGGPNPKTSSFAYPSKVIGAVVEAMVLAVRADVPAKDDALEVARRAADFLIETSVPEGGPLAYFPLTYDTQHVEKPWEPAVENEGLVMMFYPAEVGIKYLGLHGVSGDVKYLKAAKRIADTYARTQQEAGSWPVKARIDTGEPAPDRPVMPVHMVRFLHQLIHEQGQTQYVETHDRALAWIMENPVRTFNWEGQFEDVKQDYPAYKNLSARAAALYFAEYMLERFPEDEKKRSLARELLRYSEDQFVIWEQPMPLSTGEHLAAATQQSTWLKQDTARWVTPCVLEQYVYYVPIGTSGSVALETFLAAWRAEGREIDLAKALSLANSMVEIQSQHKDDCIPFFWHAEYPWACGGWINNQTFPVRALLDMADALEGKKVTVR